MSFSTKLRTLFISPTLFAIENYIYIIYGVQRRGDFMKYLILSLVANLLVFGVLSAIGLNINILAAMMMILVIPITISGILFFKTNLDKTYIFLTYFL